MVALKYALVVTMALVWATMSPFGVLEVRAEEKLTCQPESGLLITEVQAGTSNFRHEFVELHNNNALSEIDLTGCEVVFNNANWQELARVDLKGSLPPGGFMWLVHNSYLNYLLDNDIDVFEPLVVFGQDNGNLNALPAGAGLVYLADAQGDLVDSVAYGAVKDYDRPAVAPPSGSSIKRCTNEDGFFLRTTNAVDFSVSPPPTLSMLFTQGPPCPQPNPDCELVIISELLVNPVGPSSGQQFIELHNPTTQPRKLAGCGLQSTGGGQVYIFSDLELLPGQYRAFYDSQTNTRLPIAPGGTVFWLSPLQEEIQAVKYPAGMTEGTSWSWFGGSTYQATYQPTPDNPNSLVAERPCPPGQQRNPETNRCRNAAVASSSLTPCRVNQVRNPETNRCRNINTSSSLTPCRPGQVRNPETNRCRAASSSSALQPCAPGQQRNPLTNRCRKVASATTEMEDIEDVEALAVANMMNWWLAGGAMAGALSYGAYEWRQELRKLLTSFKKIVGITSGPPGI